MEAGTAAQIGCFLLWGRDCGLSLGLGVKQVPTYLPNQESSHPDVRYLPGAYLFSQTLITVLKDMYNYSLSQKTMIRLGGE